MTAAQLAETAEERVARLTVRLDDGFQKIGEAMSHGIEVDNWERHWIQILREYEQLNDEIEAHHAEAVPQQQEMALVGVRRVREERL